MFRCLVLLALLLVLAAPAYANGAMGLVYATFNWDSWLIYVVVTVLYEAALLGRWAKMSFPKALIISALANAVTALLGAGLVSGAFGITAYSLAARSDAEPNPLAHAVFCLLVGGIFSALIEAIFWAKAARRRALLASLLVHLAGVPLALLILLLPPRPYVGMEATARHQRSMVRGSVIKALEKTLQQSSNTPVLLPKTWAELLHRVGPAMTDSDKYSPEVLRVSGFEPHYSRFATYEEFQSPAEFNPALVGKDLRTIEKPNWLIRWKWFARTTGVGINADGTLTTTADPVNWVELQKELAATESR